MGKLLFAVVGAVGVTVGVVVGVLFAPRKGSETREEIARRSGPVQDAARSTASRMGQRIRPVVKLAGDRIRLGARAKGVSDGEERTSEGGGEDEQVGGQHSNGTTNGRRAELEKVGSVI